MFFLALDGWFPVFSKGLCLFTRRYWVSQYQLAFIASLKALPPNTVASKVKISIHEFHEDTIQSIAGDNPHGKDFVLIFTVIMN